MKFRLWAKVLVGLQTWHDSLSGMVPRCLSPVSFNMKKQAAGLVASCPNRLVADACFADAIRPEPKTLRDRSPRAEPERPGTARELQLLLRNSDGSPTLQAGALVKHSW